MGAPVTRSGEPSPALRAGGVLAQARRGAQGRSGPQPDVCSVGLAPRAVPVTVPAGDVADG